MFGRRFFAARLFGPRYFGDGGDVPAPVVQQEYGGWFGPQHKRRTPEELKAERIRLGILPPAVAKIANKVAQKAIKRATETRQGDVLEWALQAEQQALYERQIRLEMARQQQVWDAAYQRLFEIAVQEALQNEEEAILMLMFEL